MPEAESTEAPPPSASPRSLGALRSWRQWSLRARLLAIAGLALIAVVVLSYRGFAPSNPNWNAPLAYPTKGAGAHLQRAHFTPAAVCGGCHQTHYQQWLESGMGRSSAASKFLVELYEASLDLRGAPVEDVEQCLRCHAPLATIGAPQDLGMQEAISQEGVTCDVCHTAVAAAANDAPGMIEWDPQGPKRGPLPGPDDPAVPGVPVAVSPHHKTKQSALHTSSELCGACHMSLWPANALPIDWTYAEWQRSPYPAQGKSCQSCHMPTYEGIAAPGAPTRRLHDHSFAGGGDEALVRQAAQIEIHAHAHFAGTEVEIEVENSGAGHSFPTGNATAPVVKLEFVAFDAEDAEVFRDTREYRLIYEDAHGEVTSDPTTAVRLRSDTTLQPLQPRHERFYLVRSLGAVRVEAKLVYQRWSDDLISNHAGVVYEHVSRYMTEGVRVHRLLARLADLDYGKLDAVRAQRVVVVDTAEAPLPAAPVVPENFR